jgi:hypothetical protein
VLPVGMKGTRSVSYLEQKSEVHADSREVTR